MSVEQADLRKAFGSFMTGVTVVTARNGSNQPLGFTANSFSSVSLEPPLLLICIDKSSENLSAFSDAGHFAVNILAHDQQEISTRFARNVEDRFAGIDWSLSDEGTPILGGTAAFFSCRMHKTVDAGDHVIMIGEVVSCASTDKPGLGYHKGRYFTLGHD
ncbi:flavin reductase family protein [Alphaproteobacteria bacterium LSUCC0684]